MQLTEWAKTQTGMRGYCIRAYGEGEEKARAYHAKVRFSQEHDVVSLTNTLNHTEDCRAL